MNEEIMANKGIIYGLIDPRYGIIRYAGKSNLSLRDRFKGHIVESRNPKHNSKKVRWMRELWSLGIEPTPVLLEYNVPLSKLSKEENYFISITKEECAAFGIECVNTTQGGEGAEPVSEETKEKIRQSSREYRETKAILDENGISMGVFHKLMKNQNGNHRYYCNQKYFSEINSEEKAYWIGRMNHWRIRIDEERHIHEIGISVPNTDKEYLQQFLNTIEANYPIKESKDQKGNCGWRVSLSSKQIIKDIIRNRCDIPQHLLIHYFRGCFDGCGNWLPVGDFRFNIGCPDIKMAELFQSVIMNKCGLEKTSIQHRYDQHYIHYCGSYQITKIFDLLYSEATTYLGRKYEKFLSHRRYEHKLSKELIDNIAKDFANGMTIKEMCQKYDMAYMSIRHHLKKHELYKPRIKFTKVDDKLKNDIIDLCCNGETQKEIEKILNITSKGLVGRIIKQANKQKYTRSYVSPEIKQSIWHDFQSGIKKADISRKYGVSIQVVCLTIKKFTREIILSR
jgi:Mor family transcriptional regulator